MAIKSSQTLVSEALSLVKTISADEALKLSNEDKCTLIDIREKGELDKTGRVENSNHIPRGMLEFWLDPDGPYFKSGKIDPINFFEGIKNPNIKDQLKNVTQAAHDNEIFGVPSFVVNNKIFWGQDRLEFALDEYNK